MNGTLYCNYETIRSSFGLVFSAYKAQADARWTKYYGGSEVRDHERCLLR